MTANLRVFLWALLGMALFVNYQTWMHDYPAVVPTNVAHGEGPQVALDNSAPTASAPGAATPGAATPSAATPGTAPASTVAAT